MMTSYTSSLNWIFSQKSQMIERLHQWVGINTYSLNCQGLNQLLQVLHDAFKPLGDISQQISLPTYQKLTPTGLLQNHPLGQALSIRSRPSAPIQILLAGHLDTVFSPSSPFQSLQQQDHQRLTGPGAADMKGGLAILLTVLEALERFPFKELLGWEVLITPDEEIGSPGSTPLYREVAQRHDLALIFEPAFPDGAFVNERKGSSNFTIAYIGQPAHVGRDFDKGRSAVFPLTRLIAELQSLLNGGEISVNVADLYSNGPVNIVADIASCRINIRSSDGETLRKASEIIRSAAEHYAHAADVECHCHQDAFKLPKTLDTATTTLFAAYGQCAKELQIPFHCHATGGVCDGNILASVGLPTLDTAGVIGGGLHTENEYLLTSSLTERASLAALFLFKLASREIILPSQENL